MVKIYEVFIGNWQESLRLFGISNDNYRIDIIYQDWSQAPYSKWECKCLRKMFVTKETWNFSRTVTSNN